MTDTQIQHDGTLDIALGKNRKAATWQNRQMAWSALVAKLSKTHHTPETFATYITATKTRQDEIKDIGGFVGGYLTGGRRRKGTVLHRQILCLDVDHGHAHVWEDFQMLYPNAAAMYSTHKHSEEHPRLRIVIPLSREVLADEYVAIGRRVAGLLGIELFDTTTFEPSRMMFWPSTAADAPFVFEFQDGPWLDADEVLGSYRNWSDSSEWPMAEREREAVHHGMKKAGEPTEKPGIVGAFCRVYGIAEAIEAYLPEVYEPADVEGRYTYVHGSTAAGLVVYEDKFAFSHHGTDPTSGRLCNAFDLVRLHLYGAQDEDVKPDTPVNKLPSYAETSRLAAADAGVRKLLTAERLAQAGEDFGDYIREAAEAEGTAVDDSWVAELDIDTKGNILQTAKNYELIFQNDPVLKGRMRWDDFQRRTVLTGNMPWREVVKGDDAFSDWDEAELGKWLSRKYGLDNDKKLKAEIVSTSFRARFNSLTEYIEALEWDGVARVDSLLIDYQGAEDCSYVRTVTAKTLIACVARALKPGCKVDTVLTMVGREGNYKSTLIGKLGGAWFTDSFNFGLLKMGNKADEALQGAWIVEIPELTGLGKADVEMVKGFVARRKDKFRVVYAKHLSEFPRNCVFFGTTNNIDFLHGHNGDRRFWPVGVGLRPSTKNVHTDLTVEEVSQVWAEAKERYKAGEAWWLSAEEEVEAKRRQQEHTQTDERAGAVSAYLDTLLPEGWAEMGIMERRSFLQNGEDGMGPEGTELRTQVSVAEICVECLGMPLAGLGVHNTRPIHEIMARMDGWVRATSKRGVGGPYSKQIVYLKREKPEP